MAGPHTDEGRERCEALRATVIDLIALLELMLVVGMLYAVSKMLEKVCVLIAVVCYPVVAILKAVFGAR